MISWAYKRVPPKFPHPGGRVYLCLGTSLLENISLERGLEYNEYRRKKKNNPVSSLEIFPTFALGIFGSIGEGSFCLGYALKWNIRFLQGMI